MNIKRNKTYIIAEIGINHEGSFKKATKLIKEASISGADAVKFQIFKPETLASKKSQKTSEQKKRTKKKRKSISYVEKNGVYPSSMEKVEKFK